MPHNDISYKVQHRANRSTRTPAVLKAVSFAFSTPAVKHFFDFRRRCTGRFPPTSYSRTVFTANSASRPS